MSGNPNTVVRSGLETIRTVGAGYLGDALPS